MARQFIYHMAGLNKAYGNKKILENILKTTYHTAKSAGIKIYDGTAEVVETSEEVSNGEVES